MAKCVSKLGIDCAAQFGDWTIALGGVFNSESNESPVLSSY